MKTTIPAAFVRYHRGLARMPLAWRPWLTALLVTNMVAPLFLWEHLEARIVLATALLNGALFTWLTALSGFSRLLGLGHLPWIPLIVFLISRLDAFPSTTAMGILIRMVIAMDTLSLLLDAVNVIRYMVGERSEMVIGLGPLEPPPS